MRVSKTVMLILGLLAPAVAAAQNITVSAAVSLKEALTEIATLYETETGGKVDLNFGASGTLAVQIVQGAPVDVFISASMKPVDELVAAGLADNSSRTSIAGNQLVLIVPKDQQNPPRRFGELANLRFRHIAIGEPKVVPAGQYAMQLFKTLHLDSALSDRLVMGENVRQVLAYVGRGEADAGIVYATDAAAANDSIKIVATADDSTHDPIVYPAVQIKTGNRTAAQKLIQFLQSRKAREIFKVHGFTLPSPPTTAPATNVQSP
ncbi:MAG: molybdate ABC transporter substrate-binding protein [Planctomycetota bacterium]|nr:molybdate ABC transporter substrate-binding protein [Planctomycetota bacterium]